MNIAVFADLHGRVLLCFKLCARWERETGEKIDLILQAGDLGAYPDVSQLDRATINHAREDPTELGFSTDFAVHKPDIEKILAQTTCPMLFVRGNHEDHQWLDELEKNAPNAIFPVDVYQRILCMKTGMPYTFRKNDEHITILGIGRIAPLPGEQSETKAKYIQPYEVERLFSDVNLDCDVLLSHDVALDFLTPNYGLEEIRLVLDAYSPAYHFHGHTEEPYRQRMDANGKTRVIKMADLHWDKSTRDFALEAGGMGILRWQSPSEHEFSVVDAEWYREYTFRAWESL